MTSGSVSGSAAITFLSGPLQGQTFAIERPITRIGRDVANDIVIKDDLKVSRMHARLLLDDDGWRVENTSRSSFVRVDGARAQQAPLADGAVVYLGDDTSFAFHAPTSEDLSDVADMANHSDESQSATVYQPAPHATPLATPLATPVTPATPVASAPSARKPLVATEPPADATQVASPSLIGLPRLEITSNTSGAKQTHLLTSAVTDIGRDASNDIVIDERIVSAQHLRIVRQGGAFTLIHPHPERRQTLNGLLYQGRKIRGDEPFSKTLVSGDFFRIGDENGTFVTLTYSDGLDAAQPAAPTLEPVKLGAAELTIGRGADNSIVLAHPQVSTHHARLMREGATYRIIDLNSTNHIYVNGERIGEQTLKTGDEIRIGPYRLVYEGNQL
ncbi:MAG TPA: FHA domain-containing protein, partial [Ktedonobacterales bacterium]|nr:FHA domain-containing protein [Ktedonobacterales bacterium]